MIPITHLTETKMYEEINHLMPKRLLRERPYGLGVDSKFYKGNHKDLRFFTRKVNGNCSILSSTMQPVYQAQLRKLEDIHKELQAGVYLYDIIRCVVVYDFAIEQIMNYTSWSRTVPQNIPSNEYFVLVQNYLAEQGERLSLVSSTSTILEVTALTKFVSENFFRTEEPKEFGFSIVTEIFKKEYAKRNVHLNMPLKGIEGIGSKISEDIYNLYTKTDALFKLEPMSPKEEESENLEDTKPVRIPVESCEMPLSEFLDGGCQVLLEGEEMEISVDVPITFEYSEMMGTREELIISVPFGTKAETVQDNPIFIGAPVEIILETKLLEEEEKPKGAV